MGNSPLQVNEKGEREASMHTKLNKIVVEVESDPKVEAWEVDLVRDFASRVSVVLTRLESFEEVASSPEESNPPLRDKFNEILTRFLSIPSSIGARMARMTVRTEAIGYFQKIWNLGLESIRKTLEENGEELRIENWGVSMSVGFPMGISGTISVTFEA